MNSPTDIATTQGFFSFLFLFGHITNTRAKWPRIFAADDDAKLVKSRIKINNKPTKSDNVANFERTTNSSAISSF